MALTANQELSILIFLAKPLAQKPENYEEFLQIAGKDESPGLKKSLNALRDQFARLFQTPAETRAEKERRLRQIVDSLEASPDREEQLAGSTLGGSVDRVYRKR